MMLEDNYFHIAHQEGDAQQCRFTVDILPQCDVYRGHFPAKPVCPGACNMEMLRELAMRMTGTQLQVQSIKRCRFLKVLTPEGQPQLQVCLQATPTTTGFHVEARITKEEETIADYNAELTKI